MATALTLKKDDVIYAAESKILELGVEIADNYSLAQVKEQIHLAEKLLRYIRALQADSTLSYTEQQLIMQCMVSIGGLYDYPIVPTVTTETIVNIVGEQGPQGIQGLPGRDGGATDFTVTNLSVSDKIDEFPVTDSIGARWDYNIVGTLGQRSGTVIASWSEDGSSVKPMELSTVDVSGTTVGNISLDVQYFNGNIRLYAIVSSGEWEINGSRYYIPNNGKGTGPINALLPNGKVYIGNASNVATARTVSGDITINNSGVADITAGSIINSDISSSAAIAVNKLAALSTSKVAVTDTNGYLTTVNVTPTEASQLSGVTSNIQTQLNSKLSSTTGAISTVVATNLATNRIVVSDGSGKIAASSLAEPKKITLPAWNIQSTTSISVAHGIANGRTKIAFIKIKIYNDSDVVPRTAYPLEYRVPVFTDAPGGSYSWDDTNVEIHKIIGGFFDTASFNSTASSRGEMLIFYEG